MILTSHLNGMVQCNILFMGIRWGRDIYFSLVFWLQVYCHFLKESVFACHFQVSRAAVEGYTGEGEPPCIVMTLSADETISCNAHFTVTLIGAQPLNTSVAVSVTADLSSSDLPITNLYQGTDGM